MNDRVISLASRRPLSKDEIEKAAAKVAEETSQKTIETTLEFLDGIREQVANGQLEGLVVLGYSPQTNLFLTDIMPPGLGFPHALTPAYVGHLEMLKLSMIDIASMGPVLTYDGKQCLPIEDDWEEI